MKNLNIIQAIVSDANTQGWIDSLLRSRSSTWQRGEATTGLRAAVFTACGGAAAVDEVKIEVRAPLRESVIRVDGAAVSIDFVRCRPA